MLIDPNVAPCRTKLVLFRVKLGRVPLIPLVKYKTPVPTDRLPFSVKFPVLMVVALAAYSCKLLPLPVVSVRVAFRVKSRDC